MKNYLVSECKVDRCSNTVNMSGKGYCRRHYDQVRKYGYILETYSRTCRNEIIHDKDCSYMVLYDLNQNETARVSIDASDVERIIAYKWSLNDHGYVRTMVRRKTLYLHRMILGAIKGEEVDHKDRNKLNNTRANLRIVEHYINMHNRDCGTNVFMITERKLSKPFRAMLNVNKERIWIGYFKTKEEADLAVYKEKEKRGVLMTAI